MDCRLVNPGFRRLWVGAEGISYQNTVAVRVHTAGTAGQEECWLGYIQDIRDEHVLVDFASSRPGAAARYIHASHVWPLPFLSPDPDRPYTSVFAALRDRYDEPFRFRPATALHFDWECKMCFINLSAAGADAAAAPAAGNANAMAVVDWCQIMSELPFGQPPLLARTTGLLYTRHEILLNMNIHATAQCVFNIRTAADACQLLDSFRQGYRVQPAAALAGRGPGPGPATEADEAAMEESCRFHLRIGPDPQRCTFIVAGNQTDTASMDRTAAALHKILEQYAACRAGRLSSHTTTTSSHQTLHNERFALSAGIGSGSGSNGKRVMAASAGITGAAEASLRRLPLALLTEILEDLDLHTQAHAIRVCALWRAILGDPGTTQHISVLTDSLHSTTTRCGDHSYCCRCAMLLSRVITPTTRSLTIRADANDWQGEPFNWHILSYVQTFLEVMRIQLPFLVLKSFGLTYTDPGFWRCFRRQCDQLIVDGLEMRGTLFNRMRMALNCWSLPDDEKRFINAYRPDFQSDFHSGWHSVAHAQPSVVDATLICVPRLICKWRDPDDWEAVSRRFLLAVQRAFPPASAAVLAKVAAVHARWCRSLAYPDDWCIFRQFVKEYSGLQPNGSRHAYACDDVDLRTVDIRQLSNMALWGIAEIYIE